MSSSDPPPSPPECVPVIISTQTDQEIPLVNPHHHHHHHHHHHEIQVSGISSTMHLHQHTLIPPPDDDEDDVEPLESATTDATSSPTASSNSLDRGIAHINFKSWLFYVGVAAAIKTSLLHPLTVAMARKRVLEEHASLRTVLFHPEKIHACKASTPTCTGMLEKMKTASIQTKIRFIYRGFGIAILANILGEMAYFGILEYTRYFLEGTAFDSLRSSAGGSAAELASLCLCTPCSVVCHRQMTSGFGVASNVKYGSVVWTFRDVLFNGGYNNSSNSNTITPDHHHHHHQNTAGTTNSSATTTTTHHNHHKPTSDVRRLFAGFSVALTALPAAAIWWGLYTQVKSGLYSGAKRFESNTKNNDDLLLLVVSENDNNNNNSSGNSSAMSLGSTTDNPLINGASGITASVMTTILFNPFNVVRTRMQAGGGASIIEEATTSSSLSDSTTKKKRVRPPSAYKIASTMLKHEGYRAFMKGTVVSCSSAALEGSLVSSIYEYTKWLSDHTTN